MDKHLDEEQLFGLAEGGLDASARASAEAHLKECAGCRRELETAAGYFRQIADLEPVKAPANFLSNVRARLPRPSPLRAFLDQFMRPLRVIPMQLALLTILGLTAISSYIYQSGGLDEPTRVVPSEPSQVVMSTPSSSKGRERSAAKKEAEPPAPLAPPASPIARVPGEAPAGPLDKSSSGHASRYAAQARSKSASKPFGDVAGSEGAGDAMADKVAPPRSEDALPRVPAPPRISAAPKGGAREEPPFKASKAPDAPDAAAPAAISRPDRVEETFASETLDAGQAPSAASGSARPSAAEPQRAANAAAEEKRPSAYEELDDLKSAPVSKTMASRNGYGSGKDRAALKQKKAAVSRADSSAIRSAELPAFIVILSPGKRIGDVVSGLKAMGADSLSIWTGGDGADYQFLVPASMRKDIAPYLERYGRVEGAGLIPAAGTAPARIRIRFLPRSAP